MDGHTVFLLAIIAVQLYSVANEIRSLMDSDDASGYFQTLSTNGINVICTSLTAMYATRLHRIRHSLSRIERSLQNTVVDVRNNNDNVEDSPDGARWPVRYQTRAWLMLAAAVFGYLKYGQLMESGSGNNAYATAITALLQTVSMFGNYYVTVMFVDYVSFARR